MVIRRSQLIRLMVKWASLPLRLWESWGSSPPRAVKLITLFSTDFLGPHYVIIISSICFDHFLAFSSSERPRTWNTSTLTSKRKKKSKMGGGVCGVCNLPWSLQGSFLDTNHTYSDWTPSPGSAKAKIFITGAWSRCCPHLSTFLTARIPEKTTLHSPHQVLNLSVLCVFVGPLPHSRTVCCLYPSCQGMDCFGLVLRCTAGSGEAPVSWIEHLLPMSATAGSLF